MCKVFFFLFWFNITLKKFCLWNFSKRTSPLSKRCPNIFQRSDIPCISITPVTHFNLPALSCLVHTYPWGWNGLGLTLMALSGGYICKAITACFLEKNYRLISANLGPTSHAYCDQDLSKHEMKSILILGHLCFIQIF